MTLRSRVAGSLSQRGAPLLHDLTVSPEAALSPSHPAQNGRGRTDQSTTAGRSSVAGRATTARGQRWAPGQGPTTVSPPSLPSSHFTGEAAGAQQREGTSRKCQQPAHEGLQDRRGAVIQGREDPKSPFHRRPRVQAEGRTAFSSQMHKHVCFLSLDNAADARFGAVIRVTARPN